MGVRLPMGCVAHGKIRYLVKTHPRCCEWCLWWAVNGRPHETLLETPQQRNDHLLYLDMKKNYLNKELKFQESFSDIKKKEH